MKKGIDFVGIFVTGICHDGGGKILYRRRGPGARDEQGKWDVGAGGALEHGETIDECLTREIKEETEADVLQKTYLGYNESFRLMDGQKIHWIGFYFKCLIDPGQVVIDGKDECDAFTWSSYHEPQQPTMMGYEEEYEKFKDKF